MHSRMVSKKSLVAGLAAGGLLLGASATANAAFYQGSPDQVVIEAEGFMDRSPTPTSVPSENEAWRIMNTATDGTTDFESASGDSYIQGTPNDGDSFDFDGPTTSYDFRIDPSDDGEFFNIYARLAGPDGSSDSTNARLYSVATDGTETQLDETSSGGFGEGGNGEFIYAVRGLNGTLSANTTYRIRNFLREDGVAVDQFVAYDGTIDGAGTGVDPLSPSPLVVPEPASLALMGIGGLVLLSGRSRGA